MKASIRILLASLALIALSSYASANSFGFDQSLLVPQSGVVTISVDYDFTQTAMFGGAVDIIYDVNAIEFAQFTPGPVSLDFNLTSPAGVLTEPGLMANFGLEAVNFFSGISSEGTLGTFHFNVLGHSSAGLTPCGMVLCIVPSVATPFVSLAGADVTREVLGNGVSGASLVLPVPVPAALWLLLSGAGLLIGVRRAGPTVC